MTQTLAARGLPPIAVGTVDKFQGQEAPIVFYSIATSSTDDMPRDVSPMPLHSGLLAAVLEARCKTPQEVVLTNLLCEFIERASK